MSGCVLELVSLRGTDTVQAMLTRAPDTPLLREIYARALGHMHKPELARPVLLAWLEDARPEEQFLIVACCDALSRLGGEEARAAVQKAFYSYGALQDRLHGALGRFAGQGEEEAPATAWAWLERGDRLAAAGQFDEAIAEPQGPLHAVPPPPAHPLHRQETGMTCFLGLEIRP